MKLIIEIPDDDYELVQKYIYPQRVFYELVHGTPIPDNATNGDVMKIIFPQIGVYDEWYDEPYQKGGKEYLGGELYEGEFEIR